MDRDEILRRSRTENRGQDEMEREVDAKADAKAGRQAAAVGLLACGLLFLTEQLIKGQTNYSAWIIYCVIMCTMELSRFFKLRKKHDLINGTIMLVCTVIFLALYVRRLV